MLGGIAVDVAYVLAFQVESVGFGYVDGKVVELVHYEVEVHGRGGADGPYGYGLTLLPVGEGEAVVHPSRGQVLTGGRQVLFGYANGFQGIQDFFHVIPCQRQEDGDAPWLAAYIHCQPGPNHGCPFLRHRGNTTMEPAFRRPPSWRTTAA